MVAELLSALALLYSIPGSFTLQFRDIEILGQAKALTGVDVRKELQGLGFDYHTLRIGDVHIEKFREAQILVIYCQRLVITGTRHNDQFIRSLDIVLDYRSRTGVLRCNGFLGGEIEIGLNLP